MQEILRALARYSPLGARYWRAHVWYRRGLMALIVYFYLLYLYLVGATLWMFWAVGVNQESLSAGLVTIMPFVLVVMYPIRHGHEVIAGTMYEGIANRLRAAALVGDEHVAAPRGVYDEEALESGAFPPRINTADQPLGPFRASAAIDSATNLLYGILLTISGLLCTAVGIAFLLAVLRVIPTTLSTATTYNSIEPLLVLPFLTLIGPFLLIAAGSRLAWAWRGRRPLWLEADGFGVRPKGAQPGNPDAIAWSEIRGFWRLSVPTGLNNTKVGVYLLDTGEKTITWTIGKHPNETVWEANKLLCQLISKRTGLSLRDLSTATTMLTKWPIKTQAHQNKSPSELARALAPLAPIRNRFWVMIGTLIILLVAPLGIYAGGVAAEQAWQPQVYQGYLAPILAERPLYSDALTHDDGQWRVGASTGHNGETFAYYDGGYTLGGAGANFMWSMRPQVYGDIAVEVTVRQLGTDTTEPGVGLLLHQWTNDARIDPRQVAFTIDPMSGAWSLTNFAFDATNTSLYGWTFDQSSSLIRLGEDVTNTLVALIHGTHVFCYINGVYVGQYNDPSMHAGRVGVLNLDSNNTGVYTNFAIYAAPPHAWWQP